MNPRTTKDRILSPASLAKLDYLCLYRSMSDSLLLVSVGYSVIAMHT